MQFIFALVFFLLGLGANAVTFSDIVGSLPDGGYTADMTTYRNGVLHIADLDGNPVKGSPFVIDPIPPNVAIHGTQTKDSWGCVDGETVDEGFWSDAANKMGRWCDDGNMMPGHTMKWWKTDEDLAYMCNYANAQNCGWDEYLGYMKTIADNCGHLTSGWFLQGSGDKTYGRGIAGGRGDPAAVCSNLV